MMNGLSHNNLHAIVSSVLLYICRTYNRDAEARMLNKVMWVQQDYITVTCSDSSREPNNPLVYHERIPTSL